MAKRDFFLLSLTSITIVGLYREHQALRTLQRVHFGYNSPQFSEF